jgi:hypothetical protein
MSELATCKCPTAPHTLMAGDRTGTLAGGAPVEQSYCFECHTWLHLVDGQAVATPMVPAVVSEAVRAGPGSSAVCNLIAHRILTKHFYNGCSRPEQCGSFKNRAGCIECIVACAKADIDKPDAFAAVEQPPADAAAETAPATAPEKGE